MTEIMEMIDQELVKSGKKDILPPCGAHGGACMMAGCIEPVKGSSTCRFASSTQDIAGLKDMWPLPSIQRRGLLKYGIRMRQFGEKPGMRRKKAAFSPPKHGCGIL
jgi:hypothetical protein